MKRLLKLIILLVVIACGLYFFAGYRFDSGDLVHSGGYTNIEQNISNAEDHLSRSDRIARLFHFRAAVQEAMDKRVPKNKQVPDDEISPLMKKALVATEDRRFYEHGAIDVYGITRAAYNNVVAGRTVEGGSTITQQLVKNLFLSSKRIMSRKVEEIILAYLMEHYYTKDQILSMYLNTVYYGNNYYGIYEAAHGYFGLSPSKLDLAQASLLAGLPQAPSYFNPITNFDGAKDKQRRVLTLMAAQGFISSDEIDRAYYQALHIRNHRLTE